jgi:hypothetical protein
MHKGPRNTLGKILEVTWLMAAGASIGVELIVVLLFLGY